MRNAVIALLGWSLARCAASAVDLAPLWDPARPEVSEQRLTAALALATCDDALILRTQIARSYGLRKDFEAARQALRQIQAAIAHAGPEARVRYHLELGWTFASATHPAELLDAQARAQARAAFDRALDLARAAKPRSGTTSATPCTSWGVTTRR